MATSVEEVGSEERRSPLGSGATAGVVAGIAMGALLSVGTELMPLIGALYGMESFWWGWAAHLLNSAIFGTVFALVVSRRLIRPDPPQLGTYLAYGLVYGALLEIVTGGVLFPLWLRAAARPELALPFFPIPGTVGRFVPAIVLGVAHLVYGVTLGGTYAILSEEHPIR